MKTLLVAEPDEFSPRALALLRGAFDVELRAVDAAGLAQAFRDVDAVWVKLKHRIDAGIIGSAPRARLLVCPATGTDHIDVDACARAGVRVLSLKGEVELLKSVRATAELTIGLLLSLLRHIPAARDDVRAGRWDRDRFRGHELYEKTVGVVGVGRLGTLVASYARAFGCRVIGYDPHVFDLPAGVERAPTLGALLSQSDVVTLHVSYSPATRHLIDAAALGSIKHGALLINTSRGGVVDEAALLAALDSGALAGAALDVLDGEPGIDAAHPLVAAARTRDNLLIVPHIGGNTSESLEKVEVFMANKLLAVASEARA